MDSRGYWMPADDAGLRFGAEGETRTRTTVGRYPLKIVECLQYQYVERISRKFSRILAKFSFFWCDLKFQHAPISPTFLPASPVA